MDTSFIKRIFLSIVIFLFLGGVPAVYAQEEYIPSELSLKVYTDGYIGVDYIVEVDPTLVQVNVTLFGKNYIDMGVEDQDGLGLDYHNTPNGVTIDTIGSILAYISYWTTDLTSKDGQYWSLNITTPINTTIIFPEYTSLNTNVVAIMYGSLNGNPYVIMPSGDIKIEYTIGPVGTREHAQTLINDAVTTIVTIKAQGIFIPAAEALLQQAENSLEEEKYIEAEQYALQAKSSAQDTREKALSTQYKISQAEIAISSAKSAGRTVGLETAQNLLEQAESNYANGNYNEAENYAIQASNAASNAIKPDINTGDDVPYIWLLGGLALFVVFAGGYLFSRKKPEIPIQNEKKLEYDLEKLFRDNPHLRVDDKEVLRYLSNRGGESFASEIRERFDIPRTSLWRMIRRLEGEGVIEVENIGGQSLLRINSKYVSEEI